MRRLAGLLHRARSEESGFTLIELMSAAFVTGIGLVALISTFDSSRGLISFSEQKETAIHLAEQELDEIQAMGWDAIGLNAAPATGAGPNDLGYYASGGWYRWDRDPASTESRPAPRCGPSGAPVTNCERLITTGSVPAGLSEVSTGTAAGGTRLRLQVQRLVTWADDDCSKVAPGAAAPLCTPATSMDYKRVTVEVKVVGSDDGSRLDSGMRSPIVISTVVRER